jgi:prepilin-type N-terminal cleavage/methylation domain-containing protein
VKENVYGFTLLEILLTIAILSIILIPMMEILPGALVLETKLEHETKIVFLAQKIMEEVKSRIIYNFDFDYSETGVLNSVYSYNVTDYWLLGEEIRSIRVRVWRGTGITFNEAQEKIELNTKVAKRN